MPKKKTPFAECNGKLYIDFDYTGIHPMIALIDALGLVRFGGTGRRYMGLDEAIEWHEKERAEHAKWTQLKRDYENQSALDALKTSRERICKEMDTEAANEGPHEGASR